MSNEFASPGSSNPPEKTLIEITALLQEWLADTIDLMMQARQAHRKVKDQHFIPLHELFDKIYTDAGRYAELIAGRIVEFGCTAHGSLHLNAKPSSLPGCPLDIASGIKHVAEQARAIAFYVELMGRTATNSTHLRSGCFPAMVSANLWPVEAHDPSRN